MTTHPPRLDRRQVLAGTAGALLTGALAPHARAEDPPPAPPAPRGAAAFVGHGSPLLALDPRKGADLTAWASALPRPRAVLVVSAHYERAPTTIGATTPRPLVYDFRGFPRALYEVRYAAPGAPELARRVASALQGIEDVRAEPARGLDHGAWVPLRWLYPDADVPVLPVSLPTHDPRRLWRLGRALRSLRDEGVMVLGSGNVTHNLRQIDGRPGAPTPAWAAEFDAWLADVLTRRDVDALLDWTRRAPAARTNHPTVEHFVPVILAAAASHDDERPWFAIQGFEGGSISRRSVSWSAAPAADAEGRPR